MVPVITDIVYLIDSDKLRLYLYIVLWFYKVNIVAGKIVFYSIPSPFMKFIASHTDASEICKLEKFDISNILCLI